MFLRCLWRGIFVLSVNLVLAFASQADDLVFNTRIAFHSTRDGNEEIYVMNPDGTDQTRLTDYPALDSHPAWSPDGTRIAFASKRHGNWYSAIYVMNADGTNPIQLTDSPDASPSWSPDGTRIAFYSYRDGPKAEIYVMNADGSNQTRLTNNTAMDQTSQTTWSPDSRRVVFDSNRDGNQEIYVMNADGTNPVNLTNQPRFNDYAPSWSPDGTRIAFWSYRDNTYRQEIYVMNADGTHQTQLTYHPGADFGPSWSPDGTKIVFYSTRDGNQEIYVMNADGSNQTRLTNNTGIDQAPVWSPFLFLEVLCDVKPGSDPKAINPKSNGVIPVAILTTPQFDATTVDPLSVVFGPGQAQEAHGRGHLEDVDGDGDTDMALHFRTQDSGIQPGDTKVTLSGKTVNGRRFRCTDEIVTVGGRAAKVAVEEGFALFQNDPNPFNPTTTIRYSLAEETSVTLTIYNVQGQTVARLVNTVQPAGRYEVSYDASRLGSGIYFYRLEAGRFVETRRMLLLK